MRRVLLLALTIAAPVVGASSCGNRVDLRVDHPPVADLKVDPEPPYPLAALLPGEEGARAEEDWNKQVLIWGRGHRDRVQRICRRSQRLGLALPEGYCEPPAPVTQPPPSPG